MARKLARIVRIDAISPIKGADAIETAHIGGWSVVVKKNEFAPGALGIYFEIDSFLPDGNPAWQFLVDKVPADFNGQRGHVLRSVKLRGQVSQGLLLPLATSHAAFTPGMDVTDLLGVTKYEAPLPKELQGKARGYFPGLVPKTDEERIQNLPDELADWQQRTGADAIVWEISEKLEGNSCTWALLSGEFHVCSRAVDYFEDASNPLWAVARRHDVEARLRALLGERNIALQGELVGPGIEGNIYGFAEHEFYLFRVYDVERGTWFTPHERRALASALGIQHTPVIDEAFVLTPETGMSKLLTMADGASCLNPHQRREGLVFKARGLDVSFKVISNSYLLGQKL